MRAGISGTRDGEAWPAAGAVVELPDGVAVKLVRNGQAVEVTTVDPEPDAAPPVETRPAPTADVETRQADDGPGDG